MSYGVQSIGGSDPTQTGSTGGTSLRQLADLGLTEEQRKKIHGILTTAKAAGTSPADIQSQINDVLTDAQKAQLASRQSGNAGAAAPSGPPPNGPPPDVFANLNLIDDQKSKIKTILDGMKNGTTTAESAKTQIEALLTDSQKTQFEQNVQSAEAQFARQQQSSAGASSSTTGTSAASSDPSAATISNGLTLDDIQKQIAAAAAVLFKQIESELAPGAASATTTS